MNSEKTKDFDLPPAPITPRMIGLIAVCACVFGLLQFWYHYMAAIADGRYVRFLDPLISEYTGALAAAILFFPLRLVALRFRLDKPGWWRCVPVYLIAFVTASVCGTSMMWASRSMLFPLFGLGQYDYGRMPQRYFMEFPYQLMGFGLMVCGVYVYEHYRAARARELYAAQVEAQLSRAQLENLELKLQPHFLFNALNTISSTMYEDPAVADEMVSHLADLLRVSLRTDSGLEVPLGEELRALDHYLSIIRGRFGDDLQVSLDVDPGALAVKVPSLLLQPLVENAVRHGRASADGRDRIRISARKEQESLLVTVENAAPENLLPSGNGSGIGLSVTQDRLRLLYGGNHAFAAGPVPDGGYRVEIRIPARTAKEALVSSGDPA
jgi:two-component system LytT family sensor kinase